MYSNFKKIKEAGKKLVLNKNQMMYFLNNSSSGFYIHKKSISRLVTNFIDNLKSGLRFLNRSKIVVRILLLEDQELMINSQSHCLYR